MSSASVVSVAVSGAVSVTPGSSATDSVADSVSALVSVAVGLVTIVSGLGTPSMPISSVSKTVIRNKGQHRPIISNVVLVLVLFCGMKYRILMLNMTEKQVQRT